MGARSGHAPQQRPTYNVWRFAPWWRRPFRALLAATTILACQKAAQSDVAPPASPPIVIPFELRNGLVLVRAEVNGRATLLILDTGSGVSVLDTAFARAAGVAFSGQEVTAVGSGRTTVSLGTVRSVRVGSVPPPDLLVAAVPLEQVRAVLGHDVHGTLGYELFDTHVVVVDYERRTITVYPPKGFTYAGTGTVLPLSIEHRIPLVQASIVTRRSGTLDARLSLDLGSTTYALRLATPFVVAHDLDRDTVTVTGVFSIGVGGVTEGHLLRIRQLKLGNLAFDGPSTALAPASDGALGSAARSDGSIGAPVYRRTRLIIDYPRSRVILEPRGGVNAPDTVDASGLTLMEDDRPARTLRASYVVAGSAAADAGVRAGDELLRIDHTLASALTLDQARELLRVAGTTRHLTLRRGDRTENVSVPLRMVF